ncbi:hypothetical protein BN1723_019856, partial [Verticillium longisporum]
VRRGAHAGGKGAGGQDDCVLGEGHGLGAAGRTEEKEAAGVSRARRGRQGGHRRRRQGLYDATAVVRRPGHPLPERLPPVWSAWQWQKLVHPSAGGRAGL